MAIKYRNQTSQTQRGKPKFQDPGHYTDKDREKIDESSFAGPHRSFPILTQQDVYDAARLIGHADNPAAVKARIKAIAKKKGFKLPDSWQDEDSDRTSSPLVTRAAESVVHLTTPSEIRIVDEERREIEVCATSEAVDTFGTIFAYDASKDAFNQWLRSAGNVREMHDNKAVGKAIGVREDDESNKIWTRMRISKGAPDTWEKIKDGTLCGASIGASNVKWVDQRRDGQTRRVAVKYDLVELSLVDNPSNPDAKGIQIIRSAQPDMTILDPLEETPPVSTPTKDDAARVAAQPPVTPPSPADFYRYRQAKADRVAAAGQRAEIAERTAHPQQQFENTDAFIARVRAAAGAAEAAEMVQIAEEERAAQAQVQAVATPTPAPVAAETTRDAAPAPVAGVTTSTGLQPYEMDNGAPAAEAHVHTHKHRHADGTVHAHAHMHDHGAAHEAHRAAESDDAPHADHYHVYRAGKPIDSRLDNADETRLPASQQGSGAAMPGPKASGGATVWDNAAPSNPVKHVKANMVGSRVNYNTEDAEAKDFGVPDPEEERPTPGDDGETLTHPADMFHEGGEWPEATKLTGGTYDEDGDHDDGDDSPRISSRPPAPTVMDTSKMRPTPGNRTARADVERVGARISADSQGALHDIRDDGLDQVRKLCQHCGCDNCRAVLVMMSPQDSDDDDDGDEDDESGMRVQLAAVSRAQATHAAMTQRLAEAVEQLVGYLENQGDIAATVSDLASTIADTQRLSGAEVTRAATIQQQQLAETTRAMADMGQLVKALASSVEGVAAGVARIEATPMPSSAAAAPLAEIKRLAMDRGMQEAPAEQRIAALTEAIRSYSAQHPNDPNTMALQQEAFAAVFNATVGKR